MDNADFFFSSTLSQIGVTWFLELHSEHLKGNLFRFPRQSFVLCLVLVHSVHMFNYLHLACLVWAQAYVEQRHIGWPSFLQSLQQLEMLSALVVKFSSAETFLLSALGLLFFSLAWIGIIPFRVKIVFSGGFY